MVSIQVSLTWSLKMPRPKRLNLPGVPQHVTQRGNNRQACFFEDADYRLYLSLLAAACQRHQCTDGKRGRSFNEVEPGH